MLQYALLGILSYRPMTGYDVKSFMERSTAHFWYAKQSQIYATLKTLEEKGLLRSVVEPQADRPDRRIYHITDAGQAALQRWLAQPLTDLEPTKDTLLLKLFFSARLDKEAILAQLRIQQAQVQQALESFRGAVKDEIEEAAAAQPHLRKDALLWDITRRYGELSLEMNLRWLQEAIERIENEF